jgi:hypothetical protein
VKKKRSPSTQAETLSKDKQKKSRGAQPGNHNAYKHGFRASEPQANLAHAGGKGRQDYSHLFREHERRFLDEQPLTDLSAEIELLHVTTARFLEAMQASDRSRDYESNMNALRLVNLSAQSIAALVRVQLLTGALARDAEEALGDLVSDDDEPPPAPMPAQ